MHRLGLIGGTVLLVGALVGCGGSASAPPLKPAAPAQSAPAAQAPAAQPAAAQPAQPAPQSQPAKPAQLAPAPAASGEKKQMSMGTTQASSGTYPYWVAVSKVINTKVPNVNITPVETGAAVENVNRMGKGEFDIALLTADVSFRALKGIGPWEGKAIDVHRVGLVYDENPNAFVVREDSGIKKLEDLNGKDYNPGMRGSATENMTKLALETLGVKPKYYVGGTDDALAAIKDRRVAGFSKAQSGPNVDSAILDLMTATPIRVLGFAKDQQSKVLAEHPYYGFTQILANTYKTDWNKDPIDTMAIFVQVALTNRVSEELGYQMIKSLVEDNKAGGEGVQAAAYSSVKGHDFVERTLKRANTPLHAGAQKYFRELGKEIPEALRSPEAK